MYQARILDKNRRLVAILPGVAWRYQREANKATGIEVMIPKEVVDIAIRDEHELLGYFRPAQMVFGNKIRVAEPTRENKAGYADLASFVQIFKGETLKASGKITGRSLGQVITVEALTEEILLEQNRTPAQYGKVWEGWDLADVARDLRFGWAAKRIKAPEQWTEAIVASSNIDYTTDPGHLMLAKTTHGVYHEYGYVTIRCNRSQIANFEKWDRVRWSADSDGMDNPDKIVWTTIQTSTDGSSWSAEWDGGLPEEVGLAFEGTSDEMWVRINLYTNDTISPAEGDEEGPPVGQTPVVFAVELVARTQPILEIGSIPATAGVTVKDLDANYSTAFEVIAKACEQTCWEFNVWDGTLNLAENLGVDRTKDFIFRAGSNIEITTLNDGDENLCNILTAYNQGQGLNALELTLTDQDGLADYGPYPKAMEFDAETIEDLETQAMDYLAEYAQPTPQYAIAVAFDVDKEPEYGVGDLVQVADPETGTVTTTRIMVEEREYAETGLAVRLELGKASINLSEAIRYQRPKDGQDGKDGKDGRPGRDGRDGKDGQPGGDADIPIPEDPEWLDYEFTSHLTVTWRKSDYATGYEVRTNLNWGSASGLIFRGYAHSHSFIPMSRDFDLYIRAYNAMDEPSINYDTMDVLLEIPATPALPMIHSYFNALKIYVTPLPSPAILGYYIYLTEDGTVNTDKIPIRAGEHLTYSAPSGKTFAVQASAFDVLGEGDKSAVIVATTNSLDILEIPEIPKSKLEESLRTEIDTAGSKADQAMEDVGNLEDLTNQYLNEVGEAKDRLASAEGRLDDAEGELDTIDATLQTHADMIAARVTQVIFEGLEGRVTDAEGQLTVLADEVAAKVSQTVYETLEQRVTDAEGELTIQADAIAARVTQTVFDTLEGRVQTAEGVLEVLPGQISAKADQTTVDLLDGRVESAEGVLGVLSGEISAKVSQTVFDALEGRVEIAEGILEVLPGEIAAKASQTEVDTLTGRVESAEGQLLVLPGQIDLKASQSQVDTLSGDVRENTSQIQLLGREITLKVQQRVDGQLVVTGIGIGFDEQGQSIVPVLADRFMVVPTVDGEGQYAFLVDSDTGKVYIPGDLTVGGLLRATELQADLAKVLLLQAEVAFLDQANVLHLKADRISVGAGVGFAQAKPPGHLWHFDRHLSSTDGVAPTEVAGASVVPDGGIAGGALAVANGGKVGYDLPMAMDTWTWAGFFSIGE